MRTLRFGIFLALFGLSVVTFEAPGQTPADRKKLEEILKQQGITDPAQIARIEATLKQKGITIAQVEQAMQKGGPGSFGKGGFGGQGGFGKGGFGGFGKGQASMADNLSAPLVDADTLAKVRLTPQQKTSYDKLAKEFDSKNKELIAKLPAANPGDDIRARIEAQIREKTGKGNTPAPPPEVQKSLDLRMEYEQKFEGLLTDAQKKILEDIRVKKAEGLLLGGK